MNYLRSWKCERCGQSQATIDRPDVEVCHVCINASAMASHAGFTDDVRRLVTHAYERGYKHGKAVGGRMVADAVREATP